MRVRFWVVGFVVGCSASSPSSSVTGAAPADGGAVLSGSESPRVDASAGEADSEARKGMGESRPGSTGDAPVGPSIPPPSGPAPSSSAPLPPPSPPDAGSSGGTSGVDAGVASGTDAGGPSKPPCTPSGVLCPSKALCGTVPDGCGGVAICLSEAYGSTRFRSCSEVPEWCANPDVQCAMSEKCVDHKCLQWHQFCKDTPDATYTTCFVRTKTGQGVYCDPTKIGPLTTCKSDVAASSGACSKGIGCPDQLL